MLLDQYLGGQLLNCLIAGANAVAVVVLGLHYENMSI